MSEDSFVGINDKVLRILSLLVVDELLVRQKSFMLGLLSEVVHLLQVLTSLHHQHLHLALKGCQMVFDFINGFLGWVNFFFLAVFLIIVGEVSGVQNTVLDAVWVLGQSLQMMRSYEPFSVAALLLRHIVHYILLIVVTW